MDTTPTLCARPLTREEVRTALRGHDRPALVSGFVEALGPDRACSELAKALGTSEEALRREFPAALSGPAVTAAV